MSSFTQPIPLLHNLKQFRDDPKKAEFAELTQSFKYFLKEENGVLYGGYIDIKKGLITDGLSVPWVLGWLFKRWGLYLKIAMVHDQCYMTQFRFTRKESDEIFYNGLRVLGCGWLKAQAAYWALRAFGWLAWNGYKK